MKSLLTLLVPLIVFSAILNAQVPITIQVNPGWNLLSLPVSVTGGTKGSLFLNASSQAYIYKNGYEQKDTLENGIGFWLKFDSTETISLSGDSITVDTIDVHPGWNIIGSLTTPVGVSTIQSEPTGIIASQFYEYVPNVGYRQIDTIQPAKGSWIKASTTGKIILIGKPPLHGPLWMTFTTANSPIYSNNIYTIFVDGENFVWFGTDNGAPYFTKGNWSGLHDSLRYPVGGVGYAYRINAITQSQDGSIWFGTQGGGVIRYFKNGFSFMFKRYFEPEIPYNVIASVAGQLNSWGEVYTSSRTNVVGVGRYTPSLIIPGEGQWRELNYNNCPLPSNNIPVVTFNNIDNTIWFGTYDAGTVQYDGASNWNIFSLPDIYNYPVLSIAFDLDGLAWVGKADSGVSVLKYSTAEWKHHYTYFSTNKIIPQGQINAVVTDQHKVRWFGTTQGLVQLNDTTWTTFNMANTPALPSDNITALCYDGYGNLWIGTKSGVAVYNPTGTWFGN